MNHLESTPDRPPAIRFTWRYLLFMHWPVSASVLRPLVPEPFEIDESEGSAWIGLIPFTMRDIRVRYLPAIPTMTKFHECNVRTYVRYGDRRGVYFFSLDATSRLGVWGAKTFWNLNYIHSNISLELKGDEIHYSVRRVREPDVTMKCVWKPGERLPQSQPGDIAHFLTERYSLFTVDRKGRPKWGPIRHEPWPLHAADLIELDDDLISAAGIEVDIDSAPLLHYADELSVKAWDLAPAG